jgi:hypothetical protein
MSVPTGDATASAAQVVTAPAVVDKAILNKNQLVEISRLIKSGSISFFIGDQKLTLISSQVVCIVSENEALADTYDLNVKFEPLALAPAAPAPVAAAPAPVASDQAHSTLWSSEQPPQQQEPLPKQPVPRRGGAPRASSSASSDGSPAGASAGSPAVDSSLAPIRKPRGEMRDDLPRIQIRDDGIYYGDTQIDTQSLPTLTAIPESAKPVFTAKGIAVHRDNGKFLLQQRQSGVIKVYTPPTQSIQKNESQPQSSSFKF